jgi:hypothetical protein
MCTISREEAAWMRGARGIKKAGRSGEIYESSYESLARETRNAGGARACIPNGRLKWFYHTNLSSCRRRAKRAGCGRVRSRNICFGHVLIVVRQGRQRRDAAAARGEQLGRCAVGRLYPSRRCTFDEFESLADSFAAGTPPLTHVRTVVTPLAPAARNLGVGLRRPCWGQTKPLCKP